MRKALVFVLSGLLTIPVIAVDVSPSKDQGRPREKNDAAGAGPGWFSGVFDGSVEARDKKNRPC